MMMEIRCPYCGSDDVDYTNTEYKWTGESELVVTDDCRCNVCGEEFVMNSLAVVSSRLVGKDWDEIDRLLGEEKE